ncbi:hypothetical protein [uncultured Apibacter sp.]|uniref:hypothetical protein n=1 Tax=uncultured Apibacter sp. TaxID=1778616 RepID=UPI0025D7B6DA|nr:hypothetical protein [uncultured Apibacter sp.]
MINLLLKVNKVIEKISNSSNDSIKISENQRHIILKYLDNVKNNILSNNYIELIDGSQISYFIIDSWSYTESLTSELLSIIQDYEKCVKKFNN